MSALAPGKLQFAARLAQAGRLDAARDLLNEALLETPENVEALSLLARICGVLRDVDGSAEAFRKALALAPARADLHFEYGAMMAAGEDYQSAIFELARAAELAPDNLDYQFHLGTAWSALGMQQNAIDCFRTVVAALPGAVRAWQSLGHAALMMSDWPLALEAFNRTLELDPTAEDAAVGLAVALRTLERHEEADTLLQEATITDPTGTLSKRLIDMELRRSGSNLNENTLWAAHYAAPLDPDALTNLALYLQRHGRLPEILPQLITAALHVGDNAQLMTLTGVGLLEAGDFSPQTESVLLHADSLGTEGHNPCNALGFLYLQRGALQDAITWFRKAHEHAPGAALIHSNLLFALRHTDHLSREELFAEHKRFGEIQESLHAPMELPALTPADADRKIRLGFVSPDMRIHPVAMFFEPYLDHLDRSKFEITIYYTRARCDIVTLRLREKADHWRHIYNLAHADSARMVREDGIDILIDLAGHTSGNGLPIFVRKPAHIQMSWLGYPGTTGLTRMDYRFSDPGAQPFSTETIISGHPIAFRPPADSPAVAPAPALKKGTITFACLNKVIKASPPALRAWAEIVRQVPDSRLIFVAASTEIDVLEQRLQEIFREFAIDPARLEIRPRMPLPEFLEFLAEVDIALEPFPYSGGTTALLTAWMGVPFVAMRGEGENGREATGLLRRMGLPELTAGDEDRYIKAAVGLANDLPRLSDLRGRLREALSNVILSQEETLATRFGDELIARWQEKVAQETAGDAA